MLTRSLATNSWALGRFTTKRTAINICYSRSEKNAVIFCYSFHIIPKFALQDNFQEDEFPSNCFKIWSDRQTWTYIWLNVGSDHYTQTLIVGQFLRLDNFKLGGHQFPEFWELKPTNLKVVNFKKQTNNQTWSKWFSYQTTNWCSQERSFFTSH